MRLMTSMLKLGDQGCVFSLSLFGILMTIIGGEPVPIEFA
jgi:hypothetical protein